MTESTNDKSPTRIVVSTIASNQSGEAGGSNNLEVCSRLRVKMEIHPISKSNYFHIVVQLLFLANSDYISSVDFFRGGNDTDTTSDIVELLFLAESRRSANHNNKGSQGSNTKSSTAQSSPPFGDGAFVELAVGSQFFVIHVFAEHKTSGQEQGMRQDQSLGLCHRVVVKVTKRTPDDGETNSSPKRGNGTKGHSTSPSQWLRNAFPPLRRVVTDDGDAAATRTERKAEETMYDDSLESPLPTTVIPPSRTIPVCLQSWRVKSIPTHGLIALDSNQEIYDPVRDSEAIMIAHGSENDRVCRGVLFEI